MEKDSSCLVTGKSKELAVFFSYNNTDSVCVGVSTDNEICSVFLSHFDSSCEAFFIFRVRRFDCGEIAVENHLFCNGSNICKACSLENFGNKSVTCAVERCVDYAEVGIRLYSIRVDLLSKNNIEIQDVSITAILEQYLAYLEEMKRLDMEIASEFITMASHLMLIKTKMLLSAAEQAEAESELDLLRREDAPGTHRFMTTDNVLRFIRTGSLFLGHPLKSAEVSLVDLS